MNVVGFDSRLAMRGVVSSDAPAHSNEKGFKAGQAEF
jgi:hypothetical protein